MHILALSLVMGLVQGGRTCTNPKGNDGDSYTEGCLKMTCKAGVWRSSLETSLCCYDRQPYLPNTTITTTEDGCASAIIYCTQEEDEATAVLQVENTCGNHSTEEQVQEIKHLLVKHMEKTDCDKDSSVSTSTTSTTTNPEHDTEGLYILSSTGRAAEYQGARLGIYEEIKEHGSMDLFRQRGGKSHIYRMADKWWSGETVGDSSAARLYTSGRLFSKTVDWYYWSRGAHQRDDQTIRFLHLTPTSCILQPSILITSTGPASSFQPDYIGSFTLVPGVFSAGRPVWRNTKGKVLKINPGIIVFGVYDGIESTAPYVKSGSGPTCPTDTKAGHSDRLGYNAWRCWDGRKFVEDATILVQ